MRKLMMTFVMAGLICLPVLAQFPFGGMRGGMDGSALLMVKDVQKELKMSEEQIKTLTDAQTEMREAMRAAFQDQDRDAITKAREDYDKVVKKVRDGFSDTQKKRLFQLEVQSAAKASTPSIFTREDVQKALKLSGDQKSKIKSALSELEGDVKDVMEDARGDFSKLREAMTKVSSLNKDSFEKITKTFTDDQKTAWKDLQGEPFKGQLQPAFGKGKGRRKKDF